MLGFFTFHDFAVVKQRVVVASEPHQPSEHLPTNNKLFVAHKSEQSQIPALRGLTSTMFQQKWSQAAGLISFPLWKSEPGLLFSPLASY